MGPAGRRGTVPRDARHTCARFFVSRPLKQKLGGICAGAARTHGTGSTQRSQGNKGPSLAVGGGGTIIHPGNRVCGFEANEDRAPKQCLLFAPSCFLLSFILSFACRFNDINESRPGFLFCLHEIKIFLSFIIEKITPLGRTGEPDTSFLSAGLERRVHSPPTYFSLSHS